MTLYSQIGYTQSLLIELNFLQYTSWMNFETSDEEFLKMIFTVAINFHVHYVGPIIHFNEGKVYCRSWNSLTQLVLDFAHEY